MADLRSCFYKNPKLRTKEKDVKLEEIKLPVQS